MAKTRAASHTLDRVRPFSIVIGLLLYCVDWSRLGATACPHGLSDCPTTLPSASFPSGQVGSTAAVCVTATDIAFASLSDAGSGYCAAFESASDPSGTLTCTPNPCGAGGYCSYIVTGAGALVECLWPL